MAYNKQVIGQPLKCESILVSCWGCNLGTFNMPNMMNQEIANRLIIDENNLYLQPFCEPIFFLWMGSICIFTSVFTLPAVSLYSEFEFQRVWIHCIPRYEIPEEVWTGPELSPGPLYFLLLTTQHTHKDWHPSSTSSPRLMLGVPEV